MRAAWRLNLLPLVALAACATVAAPGSSGSGGGSFSRRDERRLVGSFTDIRAVATSRRYVYAAGPSGIGIFDRVFGGWLPPLSREQGFIDTQLTVVAGDPVEDAVWIGVPGAVLIYRPQSEQLQRSIVVGVPDVILFDRAASGDAYVRAGGQWTRVSRIGISTPVIGALPASLQSAPTLSDVYARYPGLRNTSPLLFAGQRSDRVLRNYPVQSGTFAADQPADVWLGTNGDGLYRVDATLLRATPVRYGLLERGIGAVAVAADGVWAAGLGSSLVRAGLTFASNDLQRWRWVDGTLSVPLLGVRTSRLALRGSKAWMATDHGVVRVHLDGNESISAWTTFDGLPDDRVYALVARPDGAWAGTARGLVFISDTTDARNPRTRGIGATLLDNVPVYALAAVGDTLWAGTAAGLVAVLPSGELARPNGADPALRRRITALAWSDSVLLAATDDAVLQLAPHGGVEPSRINVLSVAQVGQVTQLAVDDRTIVLAGTDGVLLLQRTGALRFLRAPGDVPGPVLDVAMSRDWLWLATPDGLMRLRRASDGGVP